MTDNESSPRDFRQVDPDDFLNYEERYVEKGTGGGKTTSHKGKKTTQALKRQQRNRSVEQRRKDIEISIKKVLGNFRSTDNAEIHHSDINRYCAWVDDNLQDQGQIGLEDCEITFTKSSGPGGQNVNKRETKVMILHKPTNIRVESDQTRSQIKNKKLALEILQERLYDHLGSWKEYLRPDQGITVDLIKLLLD
jgi:hypothetical protein